jgi:hypothetical protein
MSENILIELDLAGAEWIVVAYLTGDQRMIEVSEGEESPHLVTGNLISGAPKELIALEDRELGHMTDPEQIMLGRREYVPGLLEGQYFLPRSMTIRQAGKKCNHGLNYDMRYKRFALTTEMDESDAKKLVDLYRKVAYPGIPIWHQTIQNELREDRTLTNCFGRKRLFLDAWGPELFDAAYAFKPQSTVFDICRIGFERMYADESDLIYPMDLLMQVHDSIVVQYPKSDPQRLALALQKVGLDYMMPLLHYNGRDFRLNVTAQIGFDRGHLRPIVLSKDVGETTESIEKTLGELEDAAAAGLA